MKILSIDTSADETSVAITSGRRIISNRRYSQIAIHAQWGGIVPSIAKRAHIERIDGVVDSALLAANRVISNTVRDPGEISRRNTPRNDIWRHIDAIAVTFGPGLAVGLEVGIKKAKELSSTNNKKLIAVNHLEGHIYSCFAQNSKGNPSHPFDFPYLALVVSGGHTSLVIFTDHLTYEIIGETLDDAAGESLDKAAKIMGLGYPGGPVIERLAKNGNANYHRFPRPMRSSKDLNFSFSGLKTSYLYFYRNLAESERKKRLSDLVASFQTAVFDSLMFKLEDAIKKTNIKNILLCGGVSANLLLRQRVRDLAKKYNGSSLFPPFTSLYGDNAAMIGIVANYKAEKGIVVEKTQLLEREPRAELISA